MSELGWPSAALKRMANGLGWPKSKALVSRETSTPSRQSNAEDVEVVASKTTVPAAPTSEPPERASRVEAEPGRPTPTAEWKKEEVAEAGASTARGTDVASGRSRGREAEPYAGTVGTPRGASEAANSAAQ